MAPEITAFSTTRHGGCSTGQYSSFNINHYCGDDELHIARNREVLCRMLGISDDKLVMPHQTHDTEVLLIDEEFLSKNTAQQQQLLEGVDALMTEVKGVCIGVSTADCIPILLYDREHGVVCAVHAGWRGTVKRIVMKAVRAVMQHFGSHPSQIVAQIGTGISLDNFEVGDEVYDTFLREGFDMQAISRRYAASDGSLAEKWHIDLPQCNRLQMMEAGIPEQQIQCSDICTYAHNTDFFSARRQGINSGRIFTGIMINGL